MENSNLYRRNATSALKPNRGKQCSKDPLFKKAFLKFGALKRIKLLPKILTRGEAVIVKILIFIIIIALFSLLTDWYFKNSIIIPASGGEYIEGSIGNPSLINPILAQANEVDRDITRLLFSGLLKQQGNKLSPDLATSYTVSEDQLTYTFPLRQDVSWHDNTPFTADDVIYTFQNIQNQEFKSPLYRSLSGVLAQKIDDYTVRFKLSQPFSPFPSLLTFGILPKHLWEDIPASTAHLADLNLKQPMGTGPFKIKGFRKDSRGVIKSYTLVRNENYYNEPPYIKKITFKFYSDYSSAVEALNQKNIDGINYLPDKYHPNITNRNSTVKSLSLPQYSAIFFNKNKNALLEKVEIRKALAFSLNRQELIEKVLDSQGEIIYGPILPGFIGYDPNIKKYEFSPEEAETLLMQNGWKKITPQEYREWQQLQEASNQDSNKEVDDDNQNKSAQDGAEQFSNQELASDSASSLDTQTPLPSPEPLTQEFFWQKAGDILSLTLTTVDNPETSQAASLVKKQWEKTGIKVQLNIMPKAKLLQEIIKPRNYEALLFGQIIGQDPDPYAFWHSSQISESGVNLAMYVNKKVDTLLEEARKVSEPAERAQKYIEFQNILKEDLPAIFLYNPTYPYILHNRVKNFTNTNISIPADRFNGIEKWYIKTKRILSLKQKEV